MMKRIITGVSLAIMLTSCATTENYEKILNSWVGAEVDELVSVWGPPQNSFNLSSGGIVLEYFNSRVVKTGGITTTRPKTTYDTGNIYGSGGWGTYSGTSTTYETTTTPVRHFNKTCKTLFTADGAGTILTWKYQGNDCKALDPDS